FSPPPPPPPPSTRSLHDALPISRALLGPRGAQPDCCVLPEHFPAAVLYAVGSGGPMDGARRPGALLRPLGLRRNRSLLFAAGVHRLVAPALPYRGRLDSSRRRGPLDALHRPEAPGG